MKKRIGVNLKEKEQKRVGTSLHLLFLLLASALTARSLPFDVSSPFLSAFAQELWSKIISYFPSVLFSVQERKNVIDPTHLF
jgi:hypothetical protein